MYKVKPWYIVALICAVAYPIWRVLTSVTVVDEALWWIAIMCVIGVFVLYQIRDILMTSRIMY